MSGSVLCGDPLKMLFDNSTPQNRYVLLRQDLTPVVDWLFWLNPSTGLWEAVSLFQNDEDLEDAIITYDNKLFVIKEDNTDKSVYQFSGSGTSWTQTGLTLLNVTCNKLSYYYDSSVPYSRVLCGLKGAGSSSNYLFEIDALQPAPSATAVNNCGQSPIGGAIFQNLIADGVTAISVNQTTKEIFVTTAKNDLPLGADKAHVFKGAYNATGTILPCWIEITDDLPNKSLIYSVSANGTTGSQTLYASSRGLGEWKRDICAYGVSLVPADVLCFGDNDGSIAASALCGYPNYAYAWSNGQATATATGLAAGTYTVTVTDANGFTLTATAAVNEPPLLSVTAQQTNIPIGCVNSNAGEATATVSGGTAPYTYAWSSGGASDVEVNLAAGIYTVTVTDANGCGPATATVEILEDLNCCATYGNPINSQNDFDLLGATISGNYDLNGSVICGSNVTFDASNFSIAQGVSITIPNGVTVDVINGSVFEACGNMWQGFIIEPGGILNIAGNSVVRHAEYGVHVQADGNLNCTGAVFDHDYVGIYIPDLQSGSVTVAGTTISCTGCTSGNPLRPEYAGQTTNPNIITYAGIEAYNSVFNIGNGATNHFIDLYRGVSLENCYNAVRNSDFKNMVSAVYYMPLGGFGIYADMYANGYLKQIGLGEYSFSPASFENCPVAIHARGGAVSISANHMTGVGQGIRVLDVKAQNIGIGNNLIEATGRGISLTANEYASYVNVSYNNIIINGSAASGMDVYEFGTAISSRIFTINCNTIAVDNGLYGMHINSAERIAIQQNTVTLNSTTISATGIALDGSTGCTLIENTVAGSGTGRHTAYRSSVSPFNSFVNNHADQTQIGYDFWSTCTNTEFKGNRMGEHDVGLHLNSDGIIGIQDQHGNKWLRYINGNNPTWIGAINDNSGSGGNGWSASKYLIHPLAPLDVFYPNTFVAGDPGPNVTPWFQHFSGIPFSATFPGFCDAYFNEPGGSEAQRLDTMAVEDSISAIDFEPEARYKAKRHVYDKVEITPSMKEDNGLFEAFYDSLKNISAGSFSDLKFQQKITLPFSLIVHLYDSLANIGLDSLMVFDSLLSISPLVGIMENKTGLLYYLDTLKNELGIYKDSVSSYIQSWFQDLKTFNDNLSYTNDIEETEKSVNQFRFAYYSAALASVDTNSLINLQSIAQLCPFAYGEAVFRARSELERFQLGSYYNDKDNCAQLGYSRQQNHEVNSVTNPPAELIVFPNPASETATVYFAHPAESGSFIEIFDIRGHLLQRLNLKTKVKMLELNFKHLSPSIYALRYNGKEKSCFTRFSIFR